MNSRRLGDWTFDPNTGAVSNGETTTRLRPQTSTLLNLLLDRAPDVVSRKEIMEELWPSGVIVDFETGIASCIKQIRVALGETAARPTYLHTVPKKGFRLALHDDTKPPCGEIPSTPNAATYPKRAYWSWIAAPVIAILVGAVVWFQLTRVQTQSPAVAVMPFELLGAAREHSELQALILDDLIHHTHRHGPDDLRVIARRSVLAAGARPISVSDLRQELAVSYLVDGTLRQVGKDLVIQVSVVDARNKQVVWAELIPLDPARPEVGLKILRGVVIDSLVMAHAVTR